MKFITRTRFALLGVITVIGIAACTPSGAININQAQITDLRSDMADFDLPIGFSADFSTHVMGYTAMAYSRGVGPSHIYLIQSEKESDREKLDQILDELVIGSGDPQTRMTVIETQSVQVRGQDTTLVISDCVNSEGTTYRQAAVAFQGDGGPALLVYSESMQNWNPTILSGLLASIQ